ncbi:MAG: CoA pyrophosphatase [Lewinellaceae bacterium]|nr:CoA pyrophosphatase [Phaeodactylibacter sp.]MCB9038215.1 CoA pyrophosphatase [Lewinellaceae bacterium]
MNDRLISILEENLQAGLPGREVQYQMAHVIRRRYEPAPPNARKAGVLALFYPKASGWHIVLIERNSSHPDDRHGGQISFPGGKFEEGDRNLADTALREAHEEVGVDPSTVTLIGELTELYIPVSNFLVKPYVGYTTITPEFRPQLSEVRAIVEAPVELLRKPEARQVTDLQLAENITLRKVPYFNVEDRIVWGATAMMLNELLEVMKQSIR